MAKYRFTNEAVKDLEEIWSRSIDYIKEGYRSTKVKSHVVFYKQQEDDTILIVRILHQSMDCEKRMK